VEVRCVREEGAEMNCKQTRQDITLRLLRKGWTTALDSALAGGVLSLSQRVGTWSREGMHIAKRWEVTKGGAKVMAYRLLKPTRWTA
jgi:hypothetical protein